MEFVNLSTALTLETLDSVIDSLHHRMRNLKIWLINNPGHTKSEQVKDLIARLTKRIQQVGELYLLEARKQGRSLLNDTSDYRGYNER